MESKNINIEKHESFDYKEKEIKNDKLNEEKEEFNCIKDEDNDNDNENNIEDEMNIKDNKSITNKEDINENDINNICKDSKYGIDEDGNPMEIKEINKRKLIAYIIEREEKNNYLIDIQGNILEKNEDDYYCYKNGEEVVIIKDFDVQNPELRIYGHRKTNFEEIKKSFEEKITKENNTKINNINNNKSFSSIKEDDKKERNIKTEVRNKKENFSLANDNNNNLNKNRSMVIENDTVEEKENKSKKDNSNFYPEINIGNSEFKNQMNLWRQRYGKNNDFIDNKSIDKGNIINKIPISKPSYSHRTYSSLTRGRSELISRTDSILKMTSSRRDNIIPTKYSPKFKKLSIPKIDKGLLYNRNYSYINIKDENYKNIRLKKKKIDKNYIRNQTLEDINNKSDTLSKELKSEIFNEDDKIKRANLLQNMKEKYKYNLLNEESKEEKKITKIDSYIYSNMKKINFMKKNKLIKCSVLKKEVNQIISNFNKNQRIKKNKEKIINNNGNKTFNYDDIPYNKKGERLFFEYGNDDIYRKIKLIPNKIRKNKYEIHNNNFQINNSIIKFENFSSNNYYRKIKHNKY